MNRALASLGIDIGAALGDLRHGRALNADGRARLIDVLARSLMALTGRPVPERAASDPEALIEAAVLIARSHGLAGIDLTKVFNTAVERNPR